MSVLLRANRHSRCNFCKRVIIALRRTGQNKLLDREVAGSDFVMVKRKGDADEMRQVWKLAAIAGTIVSIWVAMYLSPNLPENYALLLPYLPVYAVVVLGCYALGRVGYGLLIFPTCPKDALLLQKDVDKAKAFYKEKGVDLALLGLK